MDNNSNLSDKIAALVNSLNELNADAVKTQNGNKSAGTRLRKGLQTIINDSKDIRKDVLALRNNDS